MGGRMWSEKEGFGEDLLDLRTESLRSVILVTAVVAYLWACWVVWPITGANAPPEAWLGVVALILGAVVGYALKRCDVTLSSLILIAALMVANGCAMSAFGGHVTPYLFAPSVIFAGLLLGQRALFTVAASASGMVIYIGLARLGWPPGELVGPVCVILLTAFASWLSARNLYTALEWSRNSRIEAQRKAKQARDRQAELQRTLKALDEASYRIRRMNWRCCGIRRRRRGASNLSSQPTSATSCALPSTSSWASPNSCSSPLSTTAPNCPPATCGTWALCTAMPVTCRTWWMMCWTCRGSRPRGWASFWRRPTRQN